MFRIVVLADTHMPRRARELPSAVLHALSRTDAIVHLGDVTSSDVLETLGTFAKVYAVCGNNDPEELRLMVPAQRTIELGGKTFTLIHGHLGGATALQAARNVPTDSDAVLFGHSHRSHCEVLDGTLLFNPGSPTDRRWAKHRSFGLIEVEDGLRPSVILLP